ncbi:MAG: hypothetical protein KDB22_11380 [Planctomycetales bacterium]|nr:hypothetical protein [Planctomycetales bacterium]
MNTQSRRTLSITITLFAVGVTVLALQWTRNHLGDESTLTGWTLLVSTAGLYLLTARKKLIKHHLGPVAAWLQIHVYMGSFASIVFLLHIGWPIRGIFEILLAGCFVFVAVSGMVLGYLSRSTPKRLGAIANDHQQEQIPMLQSIVAQQAYQEAIQSTDFGEGATLAEFYQRRLLGFFQHPRGILYQAVPNGFKRRQLLRELNDLDRYLAEKGVSSRRALSDMVKTKDDLDYQSALQGRLRTFFMLHVSLTWSLILMIGVHVVLVYRFHGSIL